MVHNRLRTLRGSSVTHRYQGLSHTMRVTLLNMLGSHKSLRGWRWMRVIWGSLDDRRGDLRIAIPTSLGETSYHR